MTNERKTPLAEKRGERADKILTVLTSDAAAGRRLHAELRMEAKSPDAHEAREELAILHEQMRALRDDALLAVFSMSAATCLTRH